MVAREGDDVETGARQRAGAGRLRHHGMTRLRQARAARGEAGLELAEHQLRAVQQIARGGEALVGMLAVGREVAGGEDDAVHLRHPRRRFTGQLPARAPQARSNRRRRVAREARATRCGPRAVGGARGRQSFGDTLQRPESIRCSSVFSAAIISAGEKMQCAGGLDPQLRELAAMTRGIDDGLQAAMDGGNGHAIARRPAASASECAAARWAHSWRETRPRPVGSAAMRGAAARRFRSASRSSPASR